MQKEISRRGFIAKGASTLAFLPFAGLLARPVSQEPSVARTQSKRPGQLETTLVEKFVRVAHADLDAVKTLLDQEPALINACWDWGGGDWETGLGGASHMGRRDIALYLLEHNARLDVFAAAMLGKLEIVKAAAAVFPQIHKVPGPHGIPLIAHAEKGGEPAAAVLKYLRSLAAA